jgi:glucose-6-phosphate 1-dehydrogenase
MIGDDTLFTKREAVEASWTALDPVLKTYPHVLPYERGSWGPPAADVLIEPEGCWHNPG